LSCCTAARFKDSTSGCWFCCLKRCNNRYACPTVHAIWQQQLSCRHQSDTPSTPATCVTTTTHFLSPETAHLCCPFAAVVNTPVKILSCLPPCYALRAGVSASSLSCH
jgi:hypothetical protein